MTYASNNAEHGLRYKCDPLDLLKTRGFTTYSLTHEHGYSPTLVQKLRDGKVSTKTTEMLCELLNCQPGDVIEYR